MIKILLGGSPCTFWSIAQKNGRETDAEGMGWELFKNYLIAKEKFKPDFFLYENNKSAAQPIKDQISKELGVDLMYINSALVSAQNRQRFYAFNWKVEQPEDRGIVLRDILESGVVDREKSYPLLVSHQGNARDYFKKQHAQIVLEPTRIGDIGSTAQAHRVYSCDGKSVCLKAQGGGQGAKTGLYATPICHTIPQEVRVRKYTCDIGKFQECLRSHKSMSCRVISEKLNRPQTEVEHWFRTDKYFNIPDEDVWFDLKKLLNIQTTEFDDFVTVFEVREGVFEKADRCYDVDGKMSTLTTGKTDNIIAPVNKRLNRLGGLYNQDNRWGIYDTNGCSPTLTASMGMGGGHTPMISERTDEVGNCQVNPNGKKQIYEVKDGLITIKDKHYPIKLADGYYIIRKLTPVECERLQTLPDGYTKAVSNSQRYKGLGNGWTAEVIIHILNGVLKDVPRDEEIVVLSMYDGIGTGRYCLDKMGFTNVRYYAYEIDKYAKQVAMSNYPDIIQMGDAFDLRHPDWTIGY